MQGKCEGIPTLTKLGFNCVLMRDLTDAQSHYDPQSYRPGGKPWAHMDWGTRNVTRAIEDQGIAVTVEGASLARAAGLWPRRGPGHCVRSVGRALCTSAHPLLSLCRFRAKLR